MIIMHQLMNSSTLFSNMFLPHIMQLARVTSNSKALINNIFSNILGPDSVSGNLIPQFLIITHNSLLHVTFCLTYLPSDSKSECL